jgi:acetolactate synthase I/II/III large subunit
MTAREKVKVSELIAQTLEQLGIAHVFGIIGAGNVHLFEAIARHGFTEIICVHHEQAAAMAVQTYYRTSGKIAAALLTTGAGSTNGITGVVSAWADSIPCLMIAGNENSKFTYPENPLRMWGVQGYDSVEMVRKVTKYACRVTDSREASYELRKAVHIALEARPGPCWVEIPMDIQSGFVEPAQQEIYQAPVVTHAQDISTRVRNVLQALQAAKRPVLWLGHGIRLAGAQDRATRLIETMQTPALLSWAGLDMVDSQHPLVFGSAGVYGQRAANFVLQNSDYVLAIGTRLAIPQIGYALDELARSARIDVVDIDPSECQKLGARVTEKIISDASEFIDALLLQASNVQLTEPFEWIERCRNYRRDYPKLGIEHTDTDGFMNSYRFMARLNTYFKDDQTVVTDMGTALLCGHQVLNIKPGQRLMTSTGLGEMGYGLPGAIGASFALNRGEVLCLNCDGGMMMNLQELQTMIHHNLPIKLFIFNNDGYLMIKHTQKALFKSEYVGTDKISGISCPNYSKIAFAFDIPSFQIHHWEDCDAVLPKVFSMDGPVICEVFMHPEQPFVPKLSLVAKADGSLVSPPLEDLSPLLPRERLQSAMLDGLHDKSLTLAPQ